MTQEQQQAGGAARRVAFFGGSFDPPHLGHLAVARAARAALVLDTVLFAPVAAQPLKTQDAITSFEDRLAMTQLAIQDESAFEISLADAPAASGGPNYTLETLKKLGQQLPDSTLFFLMGADSFFGLRKWHRATEIPFAAPLIVASRPGESLEALNEALPPGLTMEAKALPKEQHGIAVQEFEVRNDAGQNAKLYLLPGLDIRISASEIRERLRDARTADQVRTWLPEAVAEYVRAQGLYRGGSV
jgi:nicotinate-nucleotide adenylyltransferase